MNSDKTEITAATKIALIVSKTADAAVEHGHHAVAAALYTAAAQLFRVASGRDDDLFAVCADQLAAINAGHAAGRREDEMKEGDHGPC